MLDILISFLFESKKYDYQLHILGLLFVITTFMVKGLEQGDRACRRYNELVCVNKWELVVFN